MTKIFHLSFDSNLYENDKDNDGSFLGDTKTTPSNMLELDLLPLQPHLLMPKLLEFRCTNAERLNSVHFHLWIIHWI